MSTTSITPAEFNNWLESNDCTLEAVGWTDIGLRNPATEGMEQVPLQDFQWHNPPEVEQLRTAIKAGD